MFTNTYLHQTKPFVVAVAIALVLSKSAEIFLPDAGIDNSENKALSFAYYNYNFIDSFGTANASNPNEQNFFSLDAQITLKAIYLIGKNSGFITIFDNATNQSQILSKNEIYNGYKLISINKTEVVFRKDSSDFVIALPQDNKPKAQKQISINAEDINVRFDGSVYNINRSYAKAFIDNSNSFLSNVQLKEKMTNNSIDGFEITYIKPKSLFEKIGFVIGDVIKSINNKELKSNEDALLLQKSLQNSQNVNIKVLRNSNIVELNYEIK